MCVLSRGKTRWSHSKNRLICRHTHLPVAALGGCGLRAHAMHALVWALTCVIATSSNAAAPCVKSDVLGEWIFLSHSAGTNPGSCPSLALNETVNATETVVRLEEDSDRAYAWEAKDSGVGGLSQGPPGHFTALGDADALEVRLPHAVFFAWTQGHACSSSFAGSWRDPNAELFGCFSARRRVGGRRCSDGACHSATAVVKAPKDRTVGEVAVAPEAAGKVTRRLRLGRRAEKRASESNTLAPTRLPAVSTLDEPVANETAADVAAAQVINDASLLWKASTSPHGLAATLRATLRRPPASTEVLPSRNASLSPGASNGSALSAAGLPPSLDWRTHKGGGWLSEVADVHSLPQSVVAPGCTAASHVLSAIGAVEARVRIASNNAQSETLSALDVLACSPYTRECSPAAPTSAYLVAKHGEERGFVRSSCVALSAPNGTVPPHGCAALDTTSCARSLRRRVRTVRFVGGAYMGRIHTAASEHALMRELLDGPVAISLFADGSLPLYSSGVYHPLERNYWMRMLGRTTPTFDLPSCHSGCTPPKIEHQQANLGALLVGYGSDHTTGADHWILQLPWGREWGEGGFARILRGADATIADAVVIEPMV